MDGYVDLLVLLYKMQSGKIRNRSLGGDLDEREIVSATGYYIHI